jgi:hypothetical protein
MCQETVMPDFDKPIGERMEQKTSDELNRLNGNLLELSGITILVGKGYLPMFKGAETVVGYRNPVGVAAEIFKYAFGTFNRFLKVDDRLFRIKAIG